MPLQAGLGELIRRAYLIRIIDGGECASRTSLQGKVGKIRTTAPGSVRTPARGTTPYRSGGNIGQLNGTSRSMNRHLESSQRLSSDGTHKESELRRVLAIGNGCALGPGQCLPLATQPQW
jgi:hypothetical protein